MTGWVNRRSTSTTTVFVFLSLTTTPCNTRFGISPNSLCLRRSAALFVHDRLNARDVTAHDANPARLLELPVGALEPEIELLLLQPRQLITEFIGTLCAELVGVAGNLGLGNLRRRLGSL